MSRLAATSRYDYELKTALWDALEAATRNDPELTVVRREPLDHSSLSWASDADGAYVIGTGFSPPAVPNPRGRNGFLWVTYRSERVAEGPWGEGYEPLNIELDAAQVEDTTYKMDLILAALRQHRRARVLHGLEF